VDFGSVISLHPPLTTGDAGRLLKISLLGINSNLNNLLRGKNEVFRKTERRPCKDKEGVHRKS
jgi:hypothetical protein